MEDTKTSSMYVTRKLSTRMKILAQKGQHIYTVTYLTHLVDDAIATIAITLFYLSFPQPMKEALLLTNKKHVKVQLTTINQ